MGEQLEFASAIFRRKRSFLSKGVPDWPSQDIIEYIAEYGDRLCQRGKKTLEKR